MSLFGVQYPYIWRRDSRVGVGVKVLREMDGLFRFSKDFHVHDYYVPRRVNC